MLVLVGDDLQALTPQVGGTAAEHVPGFQVDDHELDLALFDITQVEPCLFADPAAQGKFEGAVAFRVEGTEGQGAQIALSLALGGASVRLWGRRPEALPEAVARIAAAFDFLAAEGLVSRKARAEVLARIETTSNMGGAVKDAGFVIEAAAEVLEVKQELLRRAEALAPPAAITSSTTSALGARPNPSAGPPQRSCGARDLTLWPDHLGARAGTRPNRSRGGARPNPCTP